MQQFSRSLPMMLYRALDAVMPRFRLIFKEFGLTEQQWRILRVLWERHEVAFSELASVTLIPRPSLVGIIDRLMDAGLVTRRRSVDDRRNVFVCITKKGAGMEAKVMPRVRKAYAELEAQVDRSRWEQLLDTLDTLSGIEQPEDAKRSAMANE